MDFCFRRPERRCAARCSRGTLLQRKHRPCCPEVPPQRLATIASRSSFIRALVGTTAVSHARPWAIALIRSSFVVPQPCASARATRLPAFFLPDSHVRTVAVRRGNPASACTSRTVLERHPRVSHLSREGNWRSILQAFAHIDLSRPAAQTRSSQVSHPEHRISILRAFQACRPVSRDRQEVGPRCLICLSFGLNTLICHEISFRRAVSSSMPRRAATPACGARPRCSNPWRIRTLRWARFTGILRPHA